MSADADDIATEIVRRCWSFGVAVLIPPEKLVDCDGSIVSGYFDGENRRLVVAGHFDDWVGTLLHEYSHLTQWAEDSEIWRKDAYWTDRANIDSWLAGDKVSGIKGAIEARRELEADCERRTVRLARELDAPIDLSSYCRRANGYVHFYNVMLETRRWYRPERRPYHTPEVSALCNTTIDRDFSKTPAALRAALLTCV